MTHTKKVPWCLFLYLALNSQLNRCGTQLTVPRHLRRGYHWVGKRVCITRPQIHISSFMTYEKSLKYQNSFSSLWSLHLYPVRRRARRCPGRRRSRVRGRRWHRDTGHSRAISWVWKRGRIQLHLSTIQCHFMQNPRLYQNPNFKSGSRRNLTLIISISKCRVSTNTEIHLTVRSRFGENC